MTGVAEFEPEPGLVLPYVYLWRRELDQGEESGRKVRPCLIVVVITRDASGQKTVAVSPITTQTPDALRSAVEIPHKVKAHLGLDAERSWIICDEYNEFDWPGVDLGTTQEGEREFGYIPDALLERVRQEMREAGSRKSLKAVRRSE